MFASRVKVTITTPDGTPVIIRKLSARSLEKAADAKQIDHAKTAQRFGAEIVKTFAKPGELEAAVETAKKDTSKSEYNNYDRFTVLVAGIDSWGADIPLDSKAIDDLDEETATKLFHDIIDLSLGHVDMGKG